VGSRLESRRDAKGRKLTQTGADDHRRAQADAGSEGGLRSLKIMMSHEADPSRPMRTFRASLVFDVVPILQMICHGRLHAFGGPIQTTVHD
jgi:hypothetical protein